MTNRPMDNPLANNQSSGVIYTETVIYAPPEKFAADAPYQLVIVSFDNGKRLTARMMGDRVSIGDAVEFTEYRDGIPFFRKK